MSRVHSRRRVVVTGVGAVTPVGATAEATRRALLAGTSGVGRIDLFDASHYPVRIAGQVAEAALPPVSDLPLSRAGGFGLIAAHEAAEHAQLGDDPSASDRRGVCVGATAGRPSLDELAEIFHRRATDGPVFHPEAGDVVARDQNAAAAAIARTLGCAGPVIGLSTACTASGHAIGEAYNAIADDDVDVMVTGGYDSLITWLDVLGFSLLGALTTRYQDEPERASRPFSADRSGFVLGEGAVMFILEEREHAIARGAPIVAEIAGYASTMNAYRMTDPPEDGGGVTLAMRTAVDRAAANGVERSAIGYVAAHGTSTPGNDICETRAIKDVFADDAADLAISSVKSMTGHLTAAAAGLGMLGALAVLTEGYAPPTINLDRPGPDLDLNYVANAAQPVTTDAVMVNAFAFGGTNACLVLRRHDHPGHHNPGHHNPGNNNRGNGSQEDAE